MSTQTEDMTETDYDDLAAIVDDLQEDVERLDGNVLGLYQGRVPEMGRKLDELAEEVEDHERRMNRLESKLDMLESEVSGGGLFDGNG